ncbi:NUDIX hydrolase [Streptomyces sp. NPDC005281]|uniref:NUDIX hydrolase n=1 Tax=Streptomyces sp. NPDC005281 TaxID=3155712 RepID=UPI00339F1A52
MLAVHSLSPHQVEAIRLPREELSEFAFFETRNAVERLRLVDMQIMLAAYRARLGNTPPPTSLTAGTSSTSRRWTGTTSTSATGPCGTARSTATPSRTGCPCSKPGHGASSPTGESSSLPTSAPHGALPMLPGDTMEKTAPTPEDTLHREAAEEAQLTLTDPVRLGWVLDETGEVYGGVGPNARLRRAARVTAIGSAAVDLATGRPFARLLATPAQSAALLGWGPPGARQAALAAETARKCWGLPLAPHATIEEVPTEGMRLS